VTNDHGVDTSDQLIRHPYQLSQRYQATSFARDTKGPAPVLTNMVKKMAVRKTRREMLVEQDKIVKFISKYQKAKSSEDGGNPFDYIITRPSELVWDRPSKKKLEASKSVSESTDSRCKTRLL